MSINQALIAELQQETINTKKILSIVPSDKFSWKPHEKSMSLISLAHHIAGLTGWASMVVNSDELDLATLKSPKTPDNVQELLDFLDLNLNESVSALEKTTDENLHQMWKLRMGDQVFFELPKIVVIRTMCFNHIYHHRGQLSVYLRLLDVKIPGMYGPSADEEMS